MDSVLRGLVVYFFLLVVFRISGKRTLSQTTSFDLVLLLIISETTQQSMVDNDHSVTNGFLLIITLVGAAIVLATLKDFFPRLDLLLGVEPLGLGVEGQLARRRMSTRRGSGTDIVA